MCSNVELWKPVLGWENLFEVSTHGRVRSIKTKTLRILKTWVSISGYKYITLSKYVDGCESKQGFSIHRLVASAFLPNTEGLPTVNHKDADKHNNHVDNLEWQSRCGQMSHISMMKGRTFHNQYNSDKHLSATNRVIVLLNSLRKTYGFYS